MGTQAKQHVVSEAALSGVPLDCEVFGKFSDLLPAALVEEGGELQWGQQRQGKVPDFQITLTTPEGPVPCLAELKVLSAGRTSYPRGTKGKGTTRRANKLTYEYEETLRKFDVCFHGALPRQRRELGGPAPPELPPGPLLAKV